jgi:hypothetical protein
MNTKQHNIDKQLDDYFTCARNKQCPPSMKQNLYHEIGISEKASMGFSPKWVVAGLSLVFVTSVIFKITYRNHQQEQIAIAQKELQVAMHYMNEVTLKSLSAVNNNGIKPAIIKPMARTYASL